MSTNDTNHTNSDENKLIYPELSHVITGICFDVHNELGRYAKEKQYADRIEQRLKGLGIPYKRELVIGDDGNVVDFLIDNKIILEAKARRMLVREDYYQLQRYLQAAQLKLGLLVNFRSQHIKPVRVIKIDTEKKHNYKINVYKDSHY